jgi:hypothetical protein
MNRGERPIKGRVLENEREANDCENFQNSFACLIKQIETISMTDGM